MSVTFDTGVTLGVFIGFADGPLTASPTWTDISQYVRGLSIRRGRSHELDTIRAGTLTATLDNRDGRFDPTYTGGAYYPNVKPMRQILVQVTYSSTTYDLYRGLVWSWPQTWPGRVDATVQIRAVDGFRILNSVYTSTAESQEASDVRIGNLLDDASWPATLRSLDSGDVTVQAYSPSCEQILSLIQTVADTEGGLFFIDGSGYATFHSQSHRTGATSSATFGDGTGELPYQQLQVGYDDTQLWNRVEITRYGGATVAAEDATSQSTYAKRVLKKFDLLHISDSAASSLASTLLARYKDPQIRVSSMTIQPRRDSSLWPQALGLEIGDLVTVKRRPPAGNTISQDVYIEGVTHRVAPKRWDTIFELSPQT